MSSLPVRQLTPEEYLEIERQAEFKSEFFRGEMFAMSGASRAHNMIQANLIRRLGERLDGTPCRAVGSDQRVYISATGLYTYPDVVIHCDPSEFLSGQFDTLLTPKILFEILSESTERYDRITKSNHYREVESLHEYVLVSQTEPRIEVYHRLPDGEWSHRDIRGLTETLTLESVGLSIPLSEIYLRVEWRNKDAPEFE